MTLTLEQMQADIAAMLHEEPEEIGLHDNLMDLGLDSMRVMTLVERWSKTGVALDFTDIAQHLTLADWWEVVQAHLGRKGG